MSKGGKVSVASLQPNDKEGWMTKQGGSWKSWHKRWFVLKGSSLYYFKTKQDVDITGVIELAASSTVKREDSSRKVKKNTISVSTSSRTFFMYPESESETNSWLKAVQGSLDKLSGKATPQQTNNSSETSPKPKNENQNKPIKEEPPQEIVKLEGVRARLDKAKSTVPFLLNDDSSKVLEFFQIWCESIPPKKEITEGSISFEVYTAADMEKLSWRSSGPQNIFIQRMVDFFWNVGAPETEIDRLNDVGALVNPITIGSWIDMSGKGGMDGGWFFPVDVPMKFALEACDTGDPVTKVADWAEENGVTRCNYVGRDMGAAPPRQTEIRFLVLGETFEEQLDRAHSAFDSFNFPPIPEEAVALIHECHTPGLQLSVITSSEGFVRLGLMVPTPPTQVVEKLCNMTGSPGNLLKFQAEIESTGPAFAEFQYLMQGFGYGVYKEGFDVVFHYKVGEESK